MPVLIAFLDDGFLLGFLSVGVFFVDAFFGFAGSFSTFSSLVVFFVVAVASAAAEELSSSTSSFCFLLFFPFPRFLPPFFLDLVLRLTCFFLLFLLF